MQQARCIRCEDRKVVALLHDLLPAANLLEMRLDADHRAQTWPFLSLQFVDPRKAIGDQHHPPLDPSMPSVALVRCAESFALLFVVAKVSWVAKKFLGPFVK